MSIEAATGLLRAREAAAWLKISERTLWTLSKRGELRAIRFGRTVRYDTADLVAFIALRKTLLTPAEKPAS